MTQDVTVVSSLDLVAERRNIVSIENPELAQLRIRNKKISRNRRDGVGGGAVNNAQGWFIHYNTLEEEYHRLELLQEETSFNEGIFIDNKASMK